MKRRHYRLLLTACMALIGLAVLPNLALAGNGGTEFNGATPRSPAGCRAT